MSQIVTKVRRLGRNTNFVVGHRPPELPSRGGTYSCSGDWGVAPGNREILRLGQKYERLVVAYCHAYVLLLSYSGNNDWD